VAASATTYDGPVFFQHDDPIQSNTWDFSVPNLTSTTGAAPVLQVSAPPGLLPEPSPGEELWATIPSFAMGTLRGPQRGSLRLGWFWAPLPLDPAATAGIGQLLGVGVTIQPSCPYAENGLPGSLVSLWEVVFDTSPPVTVKSDNVGTVPIEGKDFAVWFKSREPGEVALTIAPR
jgi:hypothetical protein